MNKNIVVKKEKPFCQLKKLPGVEKYKVDAYWINDTSDIEPTLELGYACTSSGNNGAINIFRKNESRAEEKFRTASLLLFVNSFKPITNTFFHFCIADKRSFFNNY